MAVKKNAIRTAKECLTLQFSAKKFVSYADYYNRTPFLSAFEVKNSGSESLDEVTAVLSDDLGLLLPFEKPLPEIPYESTLQVEAENCLSPLYLAKVTAPTAGTLTASLRCGKETIVEATAPVTVLPYHYAEGLGGNLEGMAGFVRPRLADCQSILRDAEKQVKKWGGVMPEGYAAAKKNDVRLLAAAVYTAVKKYHIERVSCPMTEPFPAGGNDSLLSAGRASAAELALFLASCLEAAGLHPIIGLGKETAFAGAWLYDTCFVDGVSDDVTPVFHHASVGVSNLALFDTEDIFDGRNTSYATSEKNVLKKLESGTYEAVLDVRRCRMSRILPLPLKAKGRGDRQEDSELFDAAPAPLWESRDLRLSRIPKNRQWERKLLDLSLKNSLLSFRPKRGAIHLLAPDAERLVVFLRQGDGLLLSAYQEGGDSFRRLENAPEFEKPGAYDAHREIVEMELSQGILRAFGRATDLADDLRALLRKSRAAEEETGAKVLYLSVGFLLFQDPDSREECAAPLLLLPVTLKRAPGKGSFLLSASDEGYEVNSTLLEFLKVQFDIDIRGLDSLSDGMSVTEILASVRAGLGGAAGFSLSGDVYLSTFSFSRYAMWKDIRQNFPQYKNNRMVASLLEGRNLLKNPPLPEVREDDIPPHEILTPLPADSSQFEALQAAAAGASFVLHGPPGTGKSQTITNMIANALYEGKRVLFVAEKAAALSVVQKRLAAIGLGEFCLELHSSKTDKYDVAKRIENTLSLRETYRETEDLSDERLMLLRANLRAPVEAMHKKRRLGVSIYDGILNCLQYKNAPDLFQIECSFFDSLTKDSLASYQALLTNAAAAARECGGVQNTPFENVNLSECDETTRRRVLVAAEVLTAEVKNLKNYLSLFLRSYSQKISTLTRQKLHALREMTFTLSGNRFRAYLTVSTVELSAFYAASVRYDRNMAEFLTRYKALPDIAKEYASVEAEVDNWGENYRSSAVLSSILKKLRRLAKQPIPPENEVRDIELAAAIYRLAAEIRKAPALCRSFTDRNGNFLEKKRQEFLSPLYRLHESASAIFMDYNAELMHAALAYTADGHTETILSGLREAIDRFHLSETRLCEVLCSDPRKLPEEDILTYYTQKASGLIDNLDMLPAFALYRSSIQKLEKSGLSFIGDFMESGQLNPDNLVAAFLKSVYRNFLETNIPSDPVLSHFSAAVLDDTVEEFRLLADTYDRASGEMIRRRLIAALPTVDTEGPLSLDLVSFQRLSKQLKGVTLREFLDKSKELLRVTSPCLLMSPITVSQYLSPERDSFDLVIFDEASQLPTCEAVGSLARAKAAIVVGDRNQLPPTQFFQSGYVDEEHLESEDMESLLDEWLTLGLPERHLLWHYRSKHESLIAFSNAMYYQNRLLTFPSPDALESKVTARYLPEGIYERGNGKYNRAEAEALVQEVVQRLEDPQKVSHSVGIVTFSTAQQEYVEKRLQKELYARNLERAAYDREEPLFVKNLENVQGDERDVILFSVCYGPDKNGRVSLNFGPLNQSGGWRRLNVAVSRAREEMVIFTSMTSAMIDLSRTGSQGVAGLKAFLQFAEKGRNTLAVRSDEVKVSKNTIGRYIAEELKLYGYECRYNVGVSDFKIDVAVLDPRNRKNFILAILCDGSPDLPVRDTDVLEVQTLKRNNWNVLRVYALNFYNNPKREAKRIKEILEKIVQPEGKTRGDDLSRYRKPYRAANLPVGEPVPATALYGGDRNAEIVSRLRQIVAAEEPITEEFLLRRCLQSYGIQKSGVKLDAILKSCLRMADIRRAEIAGRTCYYKNDKVCAFDRFRVEKGEPLRRGEYDFTPYEVITVIRGILQSKVSAYFDEIAETLKQEFRLNRLSDSMMKYFEDCILYGEQNGMFLRSISDRISLC